LYDGRASCRQHGFIEIRCVGASALPLSGKRRRWWNRRGGHLYGGFGGGGRGDVLSGLPNHKPSPIPLSVAFSLTIPLHGGGPRSRQAGSLCGFSHWPRRNPWREFVGLG